MCVQLKNNQTSFPAVAESQQRNRQREAAVNRTMTKQHQAKQKVKKLHHVDSVQCVSLLSY